MGRHKGYTPEDYMKMSQSGMTFSEAAEMMGVSRQSVWDFAKRHGIEFAKGSKGRRKPESDGCIASLYVSD